MIGTAAWAIPIPVWRLLVWKTGIPLVPGTLYSLRKGMQAFLNAPWIAGYCDGTTFASITELAFTVVASPTTWSGLVVLGYALENWKNLRPALTAAALVAALSASSNRS